MANVGTLFITVAADASGVARGLSKAEQTMERFGSRLFFMGSRITAGVTVPLAGLMGAITKFGTEFDDAMTSSLAIVDSVSGEMRKKMERMAMDISERTQFTASEVAKAYYDLGSAGLAPQQQLEAIGITSDFAQAGLMDMSKSAKFLANVVNALGTDMVMLNSNMGDNATMGEQMTRVADVLTRANNKALGTIETFSKALTTRAATAGRLYKVSLEELTAALMAYHTAGIESQTAGQQLWMTLRDLQKASLNNRAAWEEFGVAIFDANEELRPLPDILEEMEKRFAGYTVEQVKAHRATGVWGEAAGKAFSDAAISQQFYLLGFQDRSRAATQALLSMSAQIRKAYNDLLTSEGETQKVRERQMQSFAKQMATYWHMIQNEGIKTFEAMRPIIEQHFIPFIKSAIENLRQIVLWFQQLSPTTQEWIVKILGLVALSGPVIAMLGSWVLFLTSLTGAIGGAIKMFVQLANVMTGGRVAGLVGMRAADAALLAGRTPVQAAIAGEAAAAAATGSKFMVAMELAVGNLIKMMPNLISLLGRAYIAIVPLVGVFKWMWDNTDRWRDFFAGLTLGASEAFIALTNTFSSSKVSNVPVLGDALMGEHVKWREWLGIATDLPQAMADATTLFVQFGYGLAEVIADIGAGIRKNLADWWDKEFLPEIRRWQAQAKQNPFTGMPLMLGGMVAEEAGGFFGGVKKAWGYEDKFFDWLETKPGGMAISGLRDYANGQIGLSNILRGGMDYWHDAAEQARGRRLPPLPSTNRMGWGFQMMNVPAAGSMKAGTIWNPQTASFPGKGKPSAADTRERDRLDQVFRELMGEGGQRWQMVTKVFAAHKDEILGNADAVERLWEEYKKVRPTLSEFPPAIEEATRTLRVNEEALAQLEGVTGQYRKEIWGVSEGAKVFGIGFGELGTNVGILENELSALYMAGGKVSSEFFEKHNDELLRLQGQYERMPPATRRMLEEHTEWSQHLSASSTDVKQARDTLKEYADSVEAMTARVADKEEELTMLRMSESDRQLRGLKKNYQQEVLAHKQKIDTMVSQLGTLVVGNMDTTNKNIAEGLRRIEAEEALGKRFLEASRRVDLERLAQSMGINKLIVMSFKGMTNEALENLIKLKDGSRLIFNEILANLSEGFAAFAAIFDASGTGALSFLANSTGNMRAGADAGVNLKMAWEGLKASWTANEGTPDLGKMLLAGVAGFAAVAQGATALQTATNQRTAGQRILGGAATGASIGGAFGPWGAAIGAGIGALVGALRKPAFADIMSRVGKDWGVEISEGLAKTIAEQSKSMFKGNRQAAEIFNIGSIIGEAGGLKIGNIGTFMNKFRDIFVMIETGAFDAAQGMDLYTREFGQFADFWIDKGVDVASVFSEQMGVIWNFLETGKVSTAQVTEFLDKNFAKFAESFEKSGRVASRAMVDLIEKYKAVQITSQSVIDFIIQQGSNAATAWTTVIGAIGSGQLDDYATKLIGTNEQIKELQDKIAKGEGDPSSNQERLNELLEYRSTLLLRQSELAAAHGAEVQRMGAIVLYTFNQMVAAGVPWTQALTAMMPAVDKLAGYYEALGIKVEDTGLAELIRYRNIMKANEALFTGADALAQGTIALTGMGRISQDTFDKIAQQGVSMYERIKVEVEKFGGSSIDALRPMVPWLTAMRDAAAEYGLTLDDGTQALIDMATEQGLLKPHVDSLEESFGRVATAMDSVAYYLEQIATKIFGLPTHRDIDINVNYNENGELPPGVNPVAPPDTPGDVPTYPDLPGAARGIYTTGQRGVATWFGEGGEAELGGPRSFMAGVLADAMVESGGGIFGAKDINVTLVMPDGEVLLRQVIRAGKKRGII